MKITSCRICSSQNLFEILNLGELFYTGIFPDKGDKDTPKGELKLILCEKCGLVQLAENFPLNLLYGENYGYRSGLNNSMVRHLHSITGKLQKQFNLTSGDTVLDIASNDGTLLKGYTIPGLTKVGIDPTSKKFKSYYDQDSIAIADFFSSKIFFDNCETSPKIITSIAMLYDLENPDEFVKNVFDTLDDKGVWFFEQSYAPWMAETGSFDTICHEHIEYYTLTVLNDLLNRNGLKIIDAFTNDSNGGSISVIAAKFSNKSLKISPNAEWLLHVEKLKGVGTPGYWLNFAKLTNQNKTLLVNLVEKIVDCKMNIMGLGASTKGNVLLQYCQFNSDVIKAIGEVNNTKYGKMTPGSMIPIVAEEEIFDMNPAFVLVLPWHFKSTFINRSRGLMESGGKLIFPLPHPEIISSF